MSFAHAGPEQEHDPARIGASPRSSELAGPSFGAGLAALAGLPDGAGMERHVAALQRTAGNRAVASMLAVQRAPVEMDEMTAPAGAPPTGAGAGGPVTSDGATTTVSGAAISLAAPMVTADGVLRASTIIADSVVASSYTPGAGNIW